MGDQVELVSSGELANEQQQNKRERDTTATEDDKLPKENHNDNGGADPGDQSSIGQSQRRIS